MLYGGEITVPKNTTKDNAIETIFSVTYGVITKVLFYPRPGHASLCHAQVYRWEHQIFPTDLEQDLHGDNHSIIWEELFELFTPPFELLVKAWNDDDTYDHTFDIFFEVLPPEAILSYVLGDMFTSTVAPLYSRAISPEGY